MSPAKGFDSFLLHVDTSHDRKFRRLTVPQRLCFITGVLALAAKSPIRGALLITESEPVTVADVAEQAGVSKGVAKATLDKLAALGMVRTDTALGCQVVSNWTKYQKEPRPSETPEAWAERKRKQREKSPVEPNADERPANVPRDNGSGRPDMSRGEEKRREELPPQTPQGGQVIKFDRKPVPDTRLVLAQWVLSEFNRQAGTSLGPFKDDGTPSEGLKRIIGALTAYPDQLTGDACTALIRKVLNGQPYWGRGKPHPGHVFSHKLVEQHVVSATNGSAQPTTDWERLTGRPA